ncbi:MAG TPA: hypothetical protein VFK57_04055 [Vicinamibacterales bacterium]|nr:hypothetical protein [Vicinamibacterales bacterium]
MLRSRRSAAFVLCLLLAVAHTWPMALAPGRHSLNHNADAELNAWIMAWVAHQLPRDPANLFEANIFYPAHDALAFSEPLIAPALMGAPLAWTGASPVLVHNLILILGFALTAFAACVTVEAWTGSMAAGLLAGSAFAFNTHTLTRLAHIQGIHIYGLPLALLAMDRAIAGGSYRAALGLAAAMTLMAYTSGYLVVFACVALGVALSVRAAEWLPRARAVLPALAAGAVVTAIAVLPIYLPYRRAAREQHMVRSLDLIHEYSATPLGYLASAGRIHFSTWSQRFFQNDVDSFFPGVTLVVLAIIGVIAAFTRPPSPRRGLGAALRARILMLMAIGAAGVVLSLGTATPLYGWLFHVFPPMQGLRAAARFGNLFLLAMAMLGGIGLALWKPRTWIAVVAVLLVNAEAMRAPFTYTPFKGIPGIYKLLADEPGRVVLAEQPFFPRWAIFQNSHYVLASTAHWRPLMNGYSGYTPDTYQQYADAFWYFPQDWAIDAMKKAGVTHVVVHLEAFHRDHMAVLPVLEKRPDFELMAIHPGGIRLYRLR